MDNNNTQFSVTSFGRIFTHLDFKFKFMKLNAIERGL